MVFPGSGFPWPGSDQVSAAAGRFWWIPGWPVARPSMNRRTPYPAGWKPLLSQKGRDSGLAVSESTETDW
jgi:hypothetical protein